MEYLHPYLFYDLRLKTPSVDNDGDLDAKIYVNNTLVKTETVTSDDWGEVEWRPTPTDFDTTIQYVPKIGVVDISGLSLSVGTRYDVRVDGVQDSGHTDNRNRVEVKMISQQPPATPTLSSWTAPPDFSQGDTVTGTASVKVIRDDLTWLQSVVTNRNYVSTKYRIDPKIYQGAENIAYSPMWMVRFHRWLHYMVELSDTQIALLDDGDIEVEPRLCYWKPGTGWEEVSLDYEPGEWRQIDLTSVDGLRPGTHYTLKDVQFAMEADSYA